jgi:hypothetical protein
MGVGLFPIDAAVTTPGVCGDAVGRKDVTGSFIE